MRRIRGLVLTGFLAALLTPGCGPSLTQEELGEIEYRVPKIPGAKEPYPLPPPVANPEAEATSDAPEEDLPLPPSEPDSTESEASAD